MRCCSDTLLPGWPDEQKPPGCSVWVASRYRHAAGPFKFCSKSATFTEAETICQTAGARLCTVTELKDNCGKGAGCGMDNLLVWAQGETV